MSKKVNKTYFTEDPTRGLSEKDIKFAELIILENRPGREAIEMAGFSPGNKKTASVMASQLKKKCARYIDFLEAEKSIVGQELKIDDFLEDMLAIIKFDIKDVLEFDKLGRISINTDTYLTKGIDIFQFDALNQTVKIKGHNKIEAIKALADVMLKVKERELDIEERKVKVLEDRVELEKARLSGELDNDTVDPNILSALDNVVMQLKTQNKIKN